ncbi:dihydroneopterin aldolase [Alkanindiges sp. WGS2144]|uniref:dihydroneopterin aldolase n=1 Tax=Alkanindiges sp. WGS2144 TaxID=3366808 RepID=UPI003750BE0C
MDKVIIEGLRVDAVIGVFDWERQITQPLLVDLEIGCDIGCAARTDCIDDAVNYKAVCDEVSQLIIDTRAQLIERLAELIAQHILVQYATVKQVKVIIRKPTAITNTTAVGVSIERNRATIRTGH